ncbi:MAG: LCP family protein [Clostridia bacterium]|nr:LCP family protein [Clostridia bacterium]
MSFIRTCSSKIRAFLRAHLAARIVLGILVTLMALWLILHPHGTKSFLILGMDNYGSLDETGRSDVTMLVQVDFTRAKLSAVTFARDMFIENENGYLTKINTVVRSKDEQTLCQLIEQNFGVPVDGWFRVNFTSVIELVDAIGGARVDLTSQEVNYLTKEGLNVYPDNPLAEGESHLNGAQALAYARCRKLDNDIGRGERQGKLISAMVRQTRHLTAARVAAVFSSLKHAWRSSYSMGEQVRLLFQALWLRGAKVQSISMPFEGTWHYGSSGSTSGVVVNLDNNKLMLLDALGMPAPKADSAP